MARSWIDVDLFIEPLICQELISRRNYLRIGGEKSTRTFIDNDNQSHNPPTTSSFEVAEPFKRVENERVKRLRFTALAGLGGPLGTTPPYCPVAPTLLRLPTRDEDDTNTQPAYHASPLRRVEPTTPIESKKESYLRMPHALSMPQSGFQALILCGPGIGLSTFTSVPSEYPKALVSIANRPMVWYVLDWCYRMGVTNITLITPKASFTALSSAIAQNPYLTSLPSPSPDILSPPDLEHTTPTAELLRLPQVQAAIKSDFILLPCDLICDVPGEAFLESYLTTLGGLGGAGTFSGTDFDLPNGKITGLGGERSGRRGGLSVWYNTENREESVKKEECDFLCTAKLDPEHQTPLSKSVSDSDQPRGSLRKLLWAMPMSELLEKCEEDKDKSWKIRQSLLSRYGAVKCLTKFRDAHIYLFPYWVKEFASLNEDFESVSEDLIGTWAKADWRKPSYRARFGMRKLFGKDRRGTDIGNRSDEPPIEEELDLFSLSSTRTTRNTTSSTPAIKQSAHFASRVQADPDDSFGGHEADDYDNEADNSNTSQLMPPPILSYIMPSTPSAPLLRRVDTTPLLLSISLLLAKIPSLEESSGLGKHTPLTSPFAHQSKIAATATIAPHVTITRADTLVDSNTAIASKCVIKSTVIGASCTIGTGARLTNCLIMDGAVIGERCVLTGTVVGKKAKVGNACTLVECEVQDGNVLADGTKGTKGEKFLVGGFEEGDEIDGEGGERFGFDGENRDEDGEGVELAFG